MQGNAMQLQVILPEEQKEQLWTEVHSVIMEAVENAKREAGLNKPFLKKMEMIKYLGISYQTFSQWESEGLPSIHMTGAVLYSKDQVSEWLKAQAI